MAVRVIEHTLRVDWKMRVTFTRDIFAASNDTLLRALADTGPRQALVVLDQGVAQSHPGLPARIEGYFAQAGPALRMAGAPRIVPGGESAKNSLKLIRQIHGWIHDHSLDRHSYVIAAGGGALLDAAGFAAATAHRGVRHVRLPTTTLAQADSGVGVKNGINLFGKKNFAGVFAPPHAVINDFDFLATLPPEEKRAGYVEAVKVACIRDRSFFENIERQVDSLASFQAESMHEIIMRCAALHLEHIVRGGDPFENGSARPLDFGHWAAHKLEQLSRFSISHGNAVALGMALDVEYSRQKGLLPAASARRILRLLKKLGFKLFHPLLRCQSPPAGSPLLQGLEEFREHLGGELTITLLREIGLGEEVHEMDTEAIASSVLELERLEQTPGS